MNRKLYVSNLPPLSTDLDLMRLFETYGNLKRVYLVRNRSAGTCKNVRFVRFVRFVIFKSISDIRSFMSYLPAIKLKVRSIAIMLAIDRQT